MEIVSDQVETKDKAVRSVEKSVCYSRWCTYVNSDWISKSLPQLQSLDRAKEFASIYWQDYSKREKAWFDNWIKSEVLLCIARADSHLWYAMKSTNNFGNVWNNDRGDVVHFATEEKWINAIAITLNNKYLWRKQTIWDLSFAWGCKIDCWKIYASSKENRNVNTINCLSHINNRKESSNYLFRIK